MYYDMTDALSILIGQFRELEISDSVKVYEFLRRVRKQFDELDNFYDYCKSIGLARTSEYPEVAKISQKRLDIMDKFIREKSGTSQYQSESEEEEEARSPEPDKKEEKLSQDDVLNLGDGGQTVEEYADKVGLAFYDGGPANHQPSLPGGFSPEVIDVCINKQDKTPGT